MFSLPWLELSRFKRHTITRLAMIVIIVIPSIYGGLYLASNWNPTDRPPRQTAGGHRQRGYGRGEARFGRGEAQRRR
jgi:hypothetical protein